MSNAFITFLETLLAFFSQLCFNLGMKTLPILFSYDDVKEIYPNQQGFFSFLKRSLKNGSIKQIKRGLYALVDPSTGNIYATKFQIASHLFPNSYFSYHEAIEYYGMANQSFVSVFTYLSPNRVPELEFENITYRSKKSVCNLEIIDRTKEEGIRIVSFERAIVDSIDSPSLAGGLEEVENALEFGRRFNIEAVIKLLEHYDKTYLYQKVGYLFEKHYGNKIPDDFYKLCLSKIGNKIFYLEPNSTRTKLNSKWKLMVKENIGGLPDELF